MSGLNDCNIILDPATSASAIRNLNNVEMEGQKLKVGYADNKSSSITNEVYRLDPSFKSSAQKLSQQQQQNSSSSSSNNTTDTTIKPESSSRSSGMNEQQLLDVLLTLQLYSQSTNENQARELLLQNPLLAFDLFKILFQLDLVDSNILKKVVQLERIPPTTVPTTLMTNVNYQELTRQVYQQPQIQLQQQQQQQYLQQQLLQQQQYSQQSVPLQQQQQQEQEQQRPVQQLYPQQYPQAQLQQQQECEKQQNTQQQHQHQHVQQNMFTPLIAQPIQQSIQRPIQQQSLPQMSTVQGIQSGMMPDVNYRPPVQNFQTGTNLFMSDMQIQERNAALILQLLNLTPQQVEMFPPDQRNRILALQQQILLQTRRH